MNIARCLSRRNENVHVTANHTAKLDAKIAMYTLCRQSDVVTNTTNGLRDSSRIGGVKNWRDGPGLVIHIIVEIAIQIEGNRASNHDVSPCFECFLHFMKGFVKLCLTRRDGKRWPESQNKI